MSDEKNAPSLMDEGGICITRETVTTPTGEYQLGDIAAAVSRIHKPLWGPFLLAALGTINLVAAVQTQFWGDWAASFVMLGGGLVWRQRGTRYVLVLETGGKKVDAWFARERRQHDRALEIIRNALG